MARHINVGLIGCGAIAESAHIPTLIRLPESRLVAVADKDSKRARMAAKKYGIDHWYRDYTDLLDNREIELVVISTPPASHAEIAVHAAKNAKQIFCEKPIALTLKDAISMTDAAQKNSVKLMIGHHLRFLEPVRIARELLLAKNSIGKLISFQGMFAGGGPFFEWHPKSDYFLKKGSGVDVAFNFGTHIFDLARWITGREVKQVQAFVGNWNDNVSVDDHVVVNLKLQDNVTGQLAALYSPTSYASPGKIDFFGSLGKISCEFLGLMPSVVLYRKGSLLSRFRGPIRITPKQRNPYLSEMKHFLDCIRKDVEPLVNGEEGIKALEIALAAYESAEKGKTSSLPLLAGE